MIHELKEIIRQVLLNQKNGFKSVLATVVDLDGSSYRGPGVRMLISETGSMTGAVSGGCVEKEIRRQAESVFKSGQAVIMTYDGRLRLGCEGMLYILLEPIHIDETFLKAFSDCLKNRNGFGIRSYYQKKDGARGNFGSMVHFNENTCYSLSEKFESTSIEDLNMFEQFLVPCFKLWLIGGEHDAVKLCTIAAHLGWEVDIVTSLKDPKELANYPGAKNVISASPQTLQFDEIDDQTAVVLMTHNYSMDLQYLLAMKDCKPAYLGMLGSSKRRDRLENDLFEYAPDLNDSFLEHIHSPAGLNIGAETPEEIAISILSEILSITRDKEPYSLKRITTKIHS